MTEPRTPPGVDTTPPSDPDALREEIEQTRADLGDTVEALAHKLDVKAQAKEAVSDVKDKASTTLSSVQSSTAARAGQLRDSATNTYRSKPQVAWGVVAAVVAVALVVAWASRRGSSR
jgi:Protein of unknown function (DUF3618)